MMSRACVSNSNIHVINEIEKKKQASIEFFKKKKKSKHMQKVG